VANDLAELSISSWGGTIALCAPPIMGYNRAMPDELSKAISDIYEAFRKIQKPVKIEACPHCHSEDEAKILLSKDLCKLTTGDVSNYTTSAMLTASDPEDFMYFLPRILDLAATDENWWVDTEIIANAIHRAGFQDWPARRKQVVLQYFQVLFRRLLLHEDVGSEIDSLLYVFARLTVDIRPSLQLIAANHARLPEIHEWNKEKLLTGHLTSGFWEAIPESEKTIVEWLRSDSIHIPSDNR
jgi:hypothetical protein